MGGVFTLRQSLGMPGSCPRPQKQRQACPEFSPSKTGRDMRGSGRLVTPDPAVISDLPAALSPTKAEIALLRAFLADEIDAILRDGD